MPPKQTQTASTLRTTTVAPVPQTVAPVAQNVVPAQTVAPVAQTVAPEHQSFAQAKSSDGRLQCKKLFLTYPQCATSKDEVLSNLRQFFGDNLAWGIVAQEEHKDGTPHIHVGAELKNDLKLRDHAPLDRLVRSELLPQGKHGNYQKMKKMPACVAYIAKMGNYAHFAIDVEKVIAQAKKGAKTSKVIKLIQEGKTPLQIMQEDPETYYHQRRKIIEFAADAQLLSNSARVLPRIVSIKVESSPSQSFASECLSSWLNGHLLPESRKTRKPRSKHLYLCGPPAIGKTSFLQELRRYLRIYDIPHESWNDSYQDGCFDLMILDEFNGQKKLNELNLLSDGYPTPLNKRGTAAYLKKDVLPLIIVSNLPITDQFSKCEGSLRDAFISRYEVVAFEEPFKIIVEAEEEVAPEKENEVVLLPDTPPSSEGEDSGRDHPSMFEESQDDSSEDEQPPQKKQKIELTKLITNMYDSDD